MEDAAPVSSALQVDDRAFESLYRLHRAQVYAYALATLRNPADAEDVTQTAFMNAYCALHRGVAPRETGRWMIAITRNVCRDRFREARRRPKEEPLSERLQAAAPAEPEYGVDELFRELGGLNPRHRTILLMREFEGRSYAEISAELGVSEAAVQALLARARRALRDELRLPMTCSQARRSIVRDLNGVASLPERQALKKHLRRCGECAEFVGRRPRTPLGVLLLPLLPFRKILAFLAGTAGGPVGSTAGGAASVTAKLAAITAAGTAAVGVTAGEIGERAQAPASRPPAAPAATAASTVRRPVLPAREATTTAPVSGPAAPAARKEKRRAAPAAGAPAPPLPARVSGAGPAPADPSRGAATAPAPGPAPAPTAPAAPAAGHAPAAPEASAPSPSGPSSPDAGAAPTAPDSPPDAAAGSDPAPPQDAASSPPAGTGTDATGTPAATSPPPDTATAEPAGVPAPPAPAPAGGTPAGAGHGQAVGRGGTPRGQAVGRGGGAPPGQLRR